MRYFVTATCQAMVLKTGGDGALEPTVMGPFVLVCETSTPALEWALEKLMRHPKAMEWAEVERCGARLLGTTPC
jgi:hypothetical protein